MVFFSIFPHSPEKIEKEYFGILFLRIKKMFSMFRSFVWLIVAIFFLSGCGIKEQEKKLEERTKSLNEKEQILLRWENELELKEADLAKRERKLDSTSKVYDTIGVYNPEIIGRWKVKMLAIETTCEGSAIGDSKTEQWEIVYQNNKYIANAMYGKNLVRVYSGIFKEGVLLLTSKPSGTDAFIKVSLRFVKQGRMEGEREISQQGNCKILYSLVLDKLP